MSHPFGSCVSPLYMRLTPTEHLVSHMNLLLIHDHQRLTILQHALTTHESRTHDCPMMLNAMESVTIALIGPTPHHNTVLSRRAR
eukprot:7481520-Alexandrium_andersonii.AAC.1